MHLCIFKGMYVLYKEVYASSMHVRIFHRDIRVVDSCLYFTNICTYSVLCTYLKKGIHTLPIHVRILEEMCIVLLESVQEMEEDEDEDEQTAQSPIAIAVAQSRYPSCVQMLSCAV